MAVFLGGRLVHLKIQHLLTYEICQGVLGLKHRKIRGKKIFLRTTWLRCLQFHFKQLGPDILENICMVSYETRFHKVHFFLKVLIIWSSYFLEIHNGTWHYKTHKMAEMVYTDQPSQPSLQMFVQLMSDLDKTSIFSCGLVQMKNVL